MRKSLFLNKVAGLSLYKKETQAQVFSCEFGKIFKNAIFKEHLREPSSVNLFNEMRGIWSRRSLRQM